MFTKKQKTILVITVTVILALSTFTMAGAKSKDDITQKIMTWAGYSDTPPVAPEPYSVYHDTQAGNTQIYDNGSWLVLAQNGAPGPAGPQGPAGPAGDTGPAGDGILSSYFYGYWHVPSGNYYPTFYSLGSPIAFNQTANKGITLSNNTFQVANTGKYLITFHLTVNGHAYGVNYSTYPAGVALKSDGSKISETFWIHNDGFMSGSIIVDLTAGQSFSLNNVGTSGGTADLGLQSANITIVQIDI